MGRNVNPAQPAPHKVLTGPASPRRPLSPILAASWPSRRAAFHARPQGCRRSSEVPLRYGRRRAGLSPIRASAFGFRTNTPASRVFSLSWLGRVAPAGEKPSARFTRSCLSERGAEPKGWRFRAHRLTVVADIQCVKRPAGLGGLRGASLSWRLLTGRQGEID